jgi:hypothetical protein
VKNEEGKYFNLVRRQLMQDKEVKEKSKVSKKSSNAGGPPTPKKSDAKSPATTPARQSGAKAPPQPAPAASDTSDGNVDTSSS